MSGESTVDADRVILWRRLDAPGHESCRLERSGSSWILSGCSVFIHEARPCRLNYVVECDEAWRTIAATVDGWIDADPVTVEIRVDSAGRWSLNGEERPVVEGCIDVDLNFSPSTNLLPIRRLGLAIGQEAPVRAAWLRFPDLTLLPLQQRYRRTGPNSYGYESDGGAFTADLEVDSTGFVTHYPRFFRAEAFGSTPS